METAILIIYMYERNWNSRAFMWVFFNLKNAKSGVIVSVVKVK